MRSKTGAVSPSLRALIMGSNPHGTPSRSASARSSRSTRHLAAHEIGREPLALLQLGVDEQALTAQRPRVLHVAEPDQGSLPRPGTALHPHLPPGHRQCGALGKIVSGGLDPEAAVPPVRPSDASGGDEGQSTTSTSTRRSWRTAAAFTTERNAATVRPPRPIT